jgi:hypothetical protein
VTWGALRERYEALTDDGLRQRARGLIVSGFVVSAIGFSIDAVESIMNSHEYSWPYNLQNVISLLYPLSWFASAWAFWWLSKVTIVGSFQISMMRKALIGLAVQTSLLAAGFVLSELLRIIGVGVFSLGGPWWIVTSQWMTGLGGLVTAMGFIVLVRVFAPVQPLYSKRDRV